MLRELYDYALRENLILPAGYVRKPVRAYISLSKYGDYVGIVSAENEKVPCPDIGLSLIHICPRLLRPQ